MGIVDLFRSTGDHLARMRGKAPVASVAVDVPRHELPEINVSADFSRRIVRVDVGGVCEFTLDQKTAVNFAKQIDGAADALGPEPVKKDEAVDITAEVDGKDGQDG